MHIIVRAEFHSREHSLGTAMPHEARFGEPLQDKRKDQTDSRIYYGFSR